MAVGACSTFIRALPVSCPGPVVESSVGSHETPGAFLGLVFEERRLHPLLCSHRHWHLTICASDKRYHPSSTAARLRKSHNYTAICKRTRYNRERNSVINHNRMSKNRRRDVDRNTAVWPYRSHEHTHHLWSCLSRPCHTGGS